MYRRPLVFKKVTLNEVKYHVYGKHPILYNANAFTIVEKIDNPQVCIGAGIDKNVTNLLVQSGDFIYYVLNHSNEVIDVMTSGCVSAPSSPDKLFSEPIVSIPDIKPTEIVIGSSIISPNDMTYDDIHEAPYYVKQKLFELRIDKVIEYNLIMKHSQVNVPTYIMFASEQEDEILHYTHFSNIKIIFYKGLYTIVYNHPIIDRHVINIANWLKQCNITWTPPPKVIELSQWHTSKRIVYIGTHITPYKKVIAAATEYWDRAKKYKNARIFPSRMFPTENTNQLYDFSAYTSLTSLPVYLKDEEDDASIPDFLYPTLIFKNSQSYKYIALARAFLNDVSKLENACIHLETKWRRIMHNDYTMFQCWYMELIYGRKFKHNYTPLIHMLYINPPGGLINPIFFRPNALLTKKECTTRRIGFVQSSLTIYRRFHEFTNELFLNFSSRDMYFVGSIVEYCLINGADSYIEQYRDSDIDIMCSDIDKSVGILYEHLHAQGYVVEKVYLTNSIRYKYRFTAHNNRTIELFAANRMQVIGYHVPCVRGYLSKINNNIDAYVSPSFICTAVTGIIPEYRWVKINKGAKNIIVKYIKRGYRFMASPLEAEALKDEDLIEEEFPPELAKHSIIDDNGNVIHPCDKGFW